MGMSFKRVMIIINNIKDSMKSNYVHSLLFNYKKYKPLLQVSRRIDISNPIVKHISISKYLKNKKHYHKKNSNNLLPVQIHQLILNAEAQKHQVDLIILIEVEITQLKVHQHQIKDKEVIIKVI